jgi:hypothetical protein
MRLRGASSRRMCAAGVSAALAGRATRRGRGGARACTLLRSKVTLQSMQVNAPLWQPRM